MEEYVIVARTHGSRTEILTNWVPPRRISKIKSAYMLEIDHLFTRETSVIHACPVKPYADASDGSKAEMKEVAEFNDRILYFVNNIKYVRKDSNEFEVLVS